MPEGLSQDGKGRKSKRNHIVHRYAGDVRTGNKVFFSGGHKHNIS